MDSEETNRLKKELKKALDKMHELEQQDQDQEMSESGSLEGPEDEDIEDEPYVHYSLYFPPILASLSYTRYYVTLFIGDGLC